MWTRSLLLVMVLAVVPSARADEIDEDAEFPNAVPTVMDKRWSFAMSYGPAALRKGGEGAMIENSPYMSYDIGARYRMVSQVELGLSLAGAVWRRYGFNDGYASGNLDVRYRIAAERAWNPFLLASFGLATFGGDPVHVVVRGGAGIERRFVSWGFTANVQLSKISGNGDDGIPMTRYDRDGVLAAAATLGAVYYWGTPRPRPVKHQIERLRR